MTLEDALRALGLGGVLGPVQPDVSGSTIANLLREMGRTPDRLEPALGSFYEQVIRTEPGPGMLHFDLWRDGQPMAALFCDYTAAPRCAFTYWDPEPRVNAFLGQAFVWAEAQVGPLRAGEPIHEAPVFVASNAELEISLLRPADGDEAQAQVILDFKSP
jgi:hypothetical protein